MRFMVGLAALGVADGIAYALFRARLRSDFTWWLIPAQLVPLALLVALLVWKQRRRQVRRHVVLCSLRPLRPSDLPQAAPSAGWVWGQARLSPGVFAFEASPTIVLPTAHPERIHAAAVEICDRDGSRRWPGRRVTAAIAGRDGAFEVRLWAGDLDRARRDLQAATRNVSR